ncbi:MAG TPA: hypothetical protein VGN51_16215 [Acidimicrobiia bacterium]
MTLSFKAIDSRPSIQGHRFKAIDSREARSRPITVSEGTPGAARQPDEGSPLMSVLMSWARSTLANVEHSLGRSDHLYDRMLVGVMVLLALAIVVLFAAS